MELVADLLSGLLAFVLKRSDRQARAPTTAGADRRETADRLGALPMDCRSRGGSERRSSDRIREFVVCGGLRDWPRGPDGRCAHVPTADPRLSRIPARRRSTPRARRSDRCAAHNRKLTGCFTANWKLSVRDSFRPCTCFGRGTRAGRRCVDQVDKPDRRRPPVRVKAATPQSATASGVTGRHGSAPP